jgi:hypothetical protein
MRTASGGSMPTQNASLATPPIKAERDVCPMNAERVQGFGELTQMLKLEGWP